MIYIVIATLFLTLIKVLDGFFTYETVVKLKVASEEDTSSFAKFLIAHPVALFTVEPAMSLALGAILIALYRYAAVPLGGEWVRGDLGLSLSGLIMLIVVTILPVIDGAQIYFKARK